MCDLSIIIVSYNVKEYLEKALISIYEASEGINKEIFVVDNNSYDGSCGMIKEKFRNVILIENSQNIGFSKANNIALKRSSGRYILLINPDTIVSGDTLLKMIYFFDNKPDCGAAGCKVLNPDKTLQLACRRGFPSPFTSFSKIVGLSKLLPKNKFFGRYNLTYLEPDQISPVDAISGSFMMVRKEVLEQVGYLDEDFFLYGEDIDWCYRIAKIGWKIYYYPETEIIHFKGRSSKKSGVDTGKEFYKSMGLFVEKHFKNRYLFYPLWFVKLGIWIRAGLFFLGKIFKLFSINIPILRNGKRRLIIFSNNNVTEINKTFKNINNGNNTVVGIFNISKKTFVNEKEIEKLENEDYLRDIIEVNKVNEIIFYSDDVSLNDIMKIINICNGLKINYELVPYKF